MFGFCNPHTFVEKCHKLVKKRWHRVSLGPNKSMYVLCLVYSVAREEKSPSCMFGAKVVHVAVLLLLQVVGCICVRGLV